jgi:hypothetical protein
LLGAGALLLALSLRSWIARGLDWRGRLALAEKGDPP